MGLFDNLKDVVHKTADEASENVRAKANETGIGRAVVNMVDSRRDSWLAKWPAGEPAGDFVLEGNTSRKAYIYYPDALSALPDFQRVLFDVVPGDVVLHSKYSGRTLDTAEDGGCIALAYGTQIVGACWGYRDVAMRLVAKGYRVRIAAEKRGMFNRDIPDMYVLGPDRY